MWLTCDIPMALNPDCSSGIAASWEQTSEICRSMLSNREFLRSSSGVLPTRMAWMKTPGKATCSSEIILIMLKRRTRRKKERKEERNKANNIKQINCWAYFLLQQLSPNPWYITMGVKSLWQRTTQQNNQKIMDVILDEILNIILFMGFSWWWWWWWWRLFLSFEF